MRIARLPYSKAFITNSFFSKHIFGARGSTEKSLSNRLKPFFLQTYSIISACVHLKINKRIKFWKFGNVFPIRNAAKIE